jgi:hypothetical protein
VLISIGWSRFSLFLVFLVSKIASMAVEVSKKGLNQLPTVLLYVQMVIVLQKRW